MNTLHCALENGADLYVKERQKIRHYCARLGQIQRGAKGGCSPPKRPRPCSDTPPNVCMLELQTTWKVERCIDRLAWQNHLEGSSKEARILDFFFFISKKWGEFGCSGAIPNGKILKSTGSHSIS